MVRSHTFDLPYWTVTISICQQYPAQESDKRKDSVTTAEIILWDNPFSQWWTAGVWDERQAWRTIEAWGFLLWELQHPLLIDLYCALRFGKWGIVTPLFPSEFCLNWKVSRWVRQMEIRTSDFVLGSYDNGLQFAELWFNLESWSSSVAFLELNLWSSPRRAGLRAEQTLIQIPRVTFLHTQARSFTQGCLQHGNRNTSKHTGMAREERRDWITTHAQIQMTPIQWVWNWTTEQVLLFSLLNRRHSHSGQNNNTGIAGKCFSYWLFSSPEH